MRLRKSFEKQLYQNIDTHKMLTQLFPEIEAAVKIYIKKLNLVENYYFVEMGVQLQTLNI